MNCRERRRVISRAIGRVCNIAMLLCFAVPMRPAVAEYPDRNIDLIIPYGPGGGFDLYARAVGRTMELHLAKGVKVIPRNIPGAGSTKGISTMYRAAPDGYTMSIVDLPGAVQPQIVGEQAPYDLDNVTWLGVVNIGVYSLVVGKNAPFQNLDAFRKVSGRLPFFATTGSTDLAMAKIVAEVLQLRAKYLTSYAGGPETHLAIIRGEADAGLGIDVVIAKHLETGELKQLVWFQKKGARGTPMSVPTADDIGHPELANLGLFRMFAAPAGLPDTVRHKLIDVVQAALNDPELAKWAKATSFPIDPGTPEKAKKLYTEQKEFLTGYRNLLEPE
jgi:tripartite-type tricarboxylate transporter receptor subunit TctC